MKQKKALLLSFIIAVTILIIGILVFWPYHKTLVPINSITGTVTGVIDKPNQSEDGYYSFDIKTNSGQKYTVNATAYLNSPLSPDINGEECVGIQKVKVGDQVEFNLPKAQNQANLFDTCYAQNLTGYYFKLN